jgi:hypothetical protein
MPKDKNKVEGHFTQQQSEDPKVGNKTPEYGVSQEVTEDSTDEDDREIFSKRTQTQTTLEDL